MITGATRGIGLAMARAYASQGASVFIASRSQASVESAINQLRLAGFRVNGIAADVSDLDQVMSLAGATIAEFGTIDIWVNNAGAAGPYGPTVQMDPGTFLDVIKTDIVGVYYGSIVAMEHFLSQGHGKLINMLGRGAKEPVPYQNAYASSKAWVRQFTQTLAQETKNSGVGIYAFSPGMVLTDLLTHGEVIQGSEDRLKNFPLVLRILAQPPEAVIDKAVWLASSATDGKTGLEVYTTTPTKMMLSALRVGIRALIKRPVPPVEIDMKVIPPQTRLKGLKH